MDVYTAIHDRRDEQAWAPEPPPHEVVERVIEAAVWAPNHRLSEPWRFHVLAGEARTALADAIAAWLAANGGSERAQGAVHGRLLRAPVVIVVVQAGAPDADERRRLEDYAACAAGMQNLLLAAHAEGLVAHFSTDMMEQGAPEHLGLGPDDRIVAYINIGHRRADAPVKTGARKPPVVSWRGLWPPSP